MASLVFRKSSLMHTSKLGLRRIESGKIEGRKETSAPHREGREEMELTHWRKLLQEFVIV